MDNHEPWADFTLPPPPHLAHLGTALANVNERGAFASLRQRGLRYSESSDSDSDSATKATKEKTKMDHTPTDSTPPAELDPSQVGMTVGMKKLYAGKEDKHGRYQWTTTMPEKLARPAEDIESEKWSLVARYVPAYCDPKRTLRLHSIVVQSPLLKGFLADVLAGYPGVSLGLKRLGFSGRFEPLIHRWKELEAAIVALRLEKDPEAAVKLEHGECLYDLIGKEFKEEIESSTDMKEQSVITYDLLWTIFQPGCYVYTTAQNQPQVYKLISARYTVDHHNRPIFSLRCQYVDYDGTKFGTSKVNLTIRLFEGTKPLMDLTALPFDSHSDKDAMRTKLIERGGKVEGLAGTQYRAYEGVGFRMNMYGEREVHTVKGRIVIDAHGWNQFNPNHGVYVTGFVAASHTTASGLDDIDDPSGVLERMRISQAKTNLSHAPWRRHHEQCSPDQDNDESMPVDGLFGSEEAEEAKRAPLTDEQKLMCCPIVRGYALKEKAWLNFFVNAVQDITFSSKAFESLVLPKNQKELILGFIRTQSEYRSQFDDHIQGKGRGIITLLYGPPGVGKTLTAESVAEEMEVPLFTMSAGDLGLSPADIESKLTRLMDMCTRWNAILLLDEADVFLEARSTHELERNKLVSIFLRVLEYYQGIMFLTTNRVQTFDPAFQSRIHISIVYPDLDMKSRRKIWANFLDHHDKVQAAARERGPKVRPSATSTTTAAELTADKSEGELQKEKEVHEKRTMPHAMTEKDVKKLADLEMNGRQIKNILKTAQLLSSQRGQPLSFEHVETVMEVAQHLHNSSADSERTRMSVFQ